jgi:ferritin-like metal-binding protein YciE
MENLRELFVHELKDMLGAEESIVPALEKLIQQSTVRELKRAFREHLAETRGQIRRLKQVFRCIGMKPESETCPGIEGILKEKRVLDREKPEAQLRDFINMSAPQKVERYEITAYEGLIEMARSLRCGREVVGLLSETLAEEENALQTLKGLAQQFDAQSIIAGSKVEDEEMIEARGVRGVRGGTAGRGQRMQRGGRAVGRRVDTRRSVRGGRTSARR